MAVPDRPPLETRAWRHYVQSSCGMGAHFFHTYDLKELDVLLRAEHLKECKEYI
jgi:hypothetical protein